MIHFDNQFKSNIMAISVLQSIIKVAKILAYAALLVTIFTNGLPILRIFIRDENKNDESLEHCLWQAFISFIGIFLFFSAVLLALTLFITELAEETKEDRDSIGTYAVHDRKIKSGYLKEIGTQTSFSGMLDLIFRANFSKDQQETALPSLNFIKYNSADKLPAKSVAKSRKTCSAPILTCNSNSSGSQSGRMNSSFEQFLVDPKLGSMSFDDLGGLDKLKQIIMEYVIKPFISGNEVDTPRGILLIGDKGTGKSCIAHAIVNQMRVMMFEKEVKFYSIDGSNCFGSCIGPGINFHDLLHNTLENNPVSVILFENIDQLYDKFIPKLLHDLSSIPRGKLLFIGTTRKRRTLNQQFLQIREHGQFDHIFEIELPDFWERASILKLHFKTKRCPVNDQNILELANLTVTFNAGELAKLVDVIKLKALEKYRRLKEKLKGLKNGDKETEKKKVHSENEVCKRSRDNRDTMTKQSLFLHPTESIKQRQTKSTTNTSGGSTASIIDHFIHDSDSDNLLTKVTQWIRQKYDDEE